MEIFLDDITFFNDNGIFKKQKDENSTLIICVDIFSYKCTIYNIIYKNNILQYNVKHYTYLGHYIYYYTHKHV
jgi:hypothetical protein